MGSVGIFAGKGSLQAQNKTKKPNIEQVGFNHLPGKSNNNMKYVIHKADSRGHANHGWLDAHHSFSFASYYNPERMQFGVLRVLNDDSIEGAKGFGMHPHDNMEIITIPLEGDLRHRDNMGNTAVIRQGDIQVMSAGTGIRHSEFNANADRPVKLLQIWVFPHRQNVEPRYDQIKINTAPNHFHQVLSPNQEDEGVWIHQNAWFYLGNFDKNQHQEYKITSKENGVYVFIIEGSADINGENLNQRDGMAIYEADSFEMEIKKGSKILLMDVPLGQ